MILAAHLAAAQSETEAATAADAEAEADADADAHAASDTAAALRVTSTPEGASLTLDGVETGLVAPATLEVEPGAHEIGGTLAGHQPDHRHIEVPAVTEVHLALVPLVPQPEPRARRPASVLNYIFAGTLLAGGVAVATGPLITTIRAGECASACDDPSEAERYEVGSQTVIWLSISAALFAGALVFALARPIRASASVSRESASLTLETTF